MQRRQRHCIAKFGYSCNAKSAVETEERQCTAEKCSGRPLHPSLEISTVIRTARRKVIEHLNVVYFKYFLTATLRICC